MNRCTKQVGLALLIIFLLVNPHPSPLRAEVLGTATYEWTGNCVDSPEEGYDQQLQFHIYFDFCASDFGCAGVKLCNSTWDAWLDSTHVDSMVTISSESDSFDCLVGRLTDGIQPRNEYLFIGMKKRNTMGVTSGCSAGMPVDVAFSLETIDFEGATITSIGLIIDELDRHIRSLRVRLVIEGSWTDTGVESCSWGAIKSIYRQ